MDGQNFENENNVTVDTTATEVSSTAEPAVWYWVFFLLFSDAVPDGSVLCLVSVVLSVQYLPISRVRPDWQRVD